MPQDWLTLEEAAAYLRVSKPTIYRFCSLGCLRYYKLAGTGQRRFRRDDLDGLMVPGGQAGALADGDPCAEVIAEAGADGAGISTAR